MPLMLHTKRFDVEIDSINHIIYTQTHHTIEVSLCAERDMKRKTTTEALAAAAVEREKSARAWI